MLIKQPNNQPLSKYKIRKILFCFCLDLNATTTSKMLAINRNTVNKYYLKFRDFIYKYQMNKFDTIIGHIELDESYFGATRIKGSHIKKKVEALINNQCLVYLKEMAKFLLK